MNKYAIIEFDAPYFKHRISTLIKILNSTVKKPAFINQDCVFIEKFLVIPDELLEHVEFEDNHKWRWKDGYPDEFEDQIPINKDKLFECEDDNSALLWYELNK